MDRKTRMYISEHKILARLAALCSYYLIRGGRRAIVKNELEMNFDRFLQNERRKNKKYIKRLMKDILYAQYRNLIDIHEYFYYRFDQLNEVGRQQYVGRVRQTIFWSKFEKDNTFEIFTQKEKTYQYFMPYFKRELITISGEKDASVFSDFVSKHNKFVVKPSGSRQGKGVRLATVHSEEEKKKIFLEICGGGKSIIEEVIEQDPQMAAFHPQSVNTIRYVTFYHKGQLTKICAVLRMGRGGNTVDNACAGGIYAPIDLDAGVVCDYGTTHMLEKYLYHPDTGAQILGAHIPKWDELNRLVEEVAKVVPGQKQVGWDFALTEKGWVMVEANNHPGIQWLVHRHGLRQEMETVYLAYNEERL